MRRKLPDMVSIQTRSATRGTDTVLGTPKSARPLRDARELGDGHGGVGDRRAAIASALLRTPNFSRMSEAKPLPVTQPHLAAVSCTTMRSSAITGSIQSVPVTIARACAGVRRDAARVVARKGGEQARAHGAEHGGDGQFLLGLLLHRRSATLQQRHGAEHRVRQGGDEHRREGQRGSRGAAVALLAADAPAK